MILCILKGISLFKKHKIIFFPENLKRILGLVGLVYHKHRLFFYLALYI